MEGRGVHSINALRPMLGAAADLCCNRTASSHTTGRWTILQHLLKIG
jgi:hypothetical protein